MGEHITFYVKIVHFHVQLLLRLDVLRKFAIKQDFGIGMMRAGNWEWGIHSNYVE